MTSQIEHVVPALPVVVAAVNGFQGGFWDTGGEEQPRALPVNYTKVEHFVGLNAAFFHVMLALTFAVIACSIEISRNRLGGKKSWSRRLGSWLEFCGSGAPSRRSFESCGDDLPGTSSGQQGWHMSFRGGSGSQALTSGREASVSGTPGGAQPKGKIYTAYSTEGPRRQFPRAAKNRASKRWSVGHDGDDHPEDLIIQTNAQTYRVAKPVAVELATSRKARQTQIKETIHLAIDYALRMASPVDIVEDHALAKLRCMRRLLNGCIDVLASMEGKDLEDVLEDRSFLDQELKMLRYAESKLLSWHSTILVYRQCILPRLQITRVRINALRDEMLLTTRPMQNTSKESSLLRAINSIHLTCLYGNVYMEEEKLFSRLEWQIFTKHRLSPAGAKYLSRFWSGSLASFTKLQLPMFYANLIRDTYDLTIFMERKDHKSLREFLVQSVVSFLQSEIQVGSMYNSELSSPNFVASAVLGLSRLENYSRSNGLGCLGHIHALFNAVLHSNFSLILHQTELKWIMEASRSAVMSVRRAFAEVRMLLRRNVPPEHIKRKIATVDSIATSHGAFLERTIREIQQSQHIPDTVIQVNIEWTAMKKRWLRSQLRALNALTRATAAWVKANLPRSIETNWV